MWLKRVTSEIIFTPSFLLSQTVSFLDLSIPLEREYFMDGPYFRLHQVARDKITLVWTSYAYVLHNDTVA